MLGLYWLVAGYGLRASRALGFLVATILVAAGAIQLWGFAELGRDDADHTAACGTRPAIDGEPGGLDDSWDCALVLSASGVAILLRGSSDALNTGGQVIQLMLRILGPALIALAVLALRARVKR